VLFNTAERAALALTCAMTRNVRGEDATFAAVRAALPDDRQAFERVTVISAYDMVSRMLVALGLEPEAHRATPAARARAARLYLLAPRVDRQHLGQPAVQRGLAGVIQFCPIVSGVSYTFGRDWMSISPSDLHPEAHRCARATWGLRLPQPTCLSTRRDRRGRRARHAPRRRLGHEADSRKTCAPRGGHHFDHALVAHRSIGMQVQVRVGTRGERAQPSVERSHLDPLAIDAHRALRIDRHADRCASCVDRRRVDPGQIDGHRDRKSVV
jgi:hypothetical protein